MATARKLLIADPDVDSVRALTRVLRQRGYAVHYAPDGSRALEVAVLRHPDLVLFDEHCRLLEARTFVQILRTNPRTEDIPVMLTARAVDTDALRGMRDGWLKKPYNVDEVLARIEHVFRRSDAASNLRKEEQELEGSLGQLGIPDLLQILALHRRSGRLALSRGEEKGDIWVGEGRPVLARLGRVEGEKALFRLVTWAEGSFTFSAGSPPGGGVRIERSMDDALLEGMRQADEVARVSASLPPRQVRLQLAPGAQLPAAQHPVTERVVALLESPRPLQEVVDLTPVPDLEVLAALSTLLSKGVAETVAEQPQEGVRPLLGPAEAHALRTRALRGRGSAPRVAVAKVVLCGSGARVRRFLDALPALSSGEPASGRTGFGTLARVEVSEAVRVDVCVLPSSEAARPLWRPFCVGAVGVLLLEEGEGPLRLARHLALEERVPLVAVDREVPESLRSAQAVGAPAAEALRTLLLLALQVPDAPLPLPAGPAAS